MTRMQFEKDIPVLNPPAKARLMRYVPQENHDGAESREEGYGIQLFATLIHWAGLTVK